MSRPLLYSRTTNNNWKNNRGRVCQDLYCIAVQQTTIGKTTEVSQDLYCIAGQQTTIGKTTEVCQDLYCIVGQQTTIEKQQR